MTRPLKLALAATLVSVLAAACSDNGVAPLAVGPTTPPLSGFTAAVTCEVTVSTATLACGPATPVATKAIAGTRRGIEPDVLTLGGQGTYVLHYAGGADEALKMLDDGIEPQLIVILSDINMPGMDGLELLRELRKLRPDLPVMMVTAYGDDERRRRASEYGAAEFITKPVDFEVLKQQLQQLPSAAG